MTVTTQEQAMRALFSDRKLTLETLLEIENKQRELVPFNLFPIQEDMLMQSTWRDIYVKPGQVGATSLWVGDFLIDNVTINGTVSVIVSYDEFSAQRLLLKAKKFHQRLQRKIPTIPKLDHKSAVELSFIHSDTDFYSTFYIFSARSYVIGRGETIHNLLMDEYGFWPIGTHEPIFASAVQRVPLKAGTKIRIQSTANGEDNPFCEMYRAAKEGTALEMSVYKPHFYYWFIHPEYIMYPDDPFCLPGDDQDPLPNLQPDEINLLRLLIETFGFGEFDAMSKIRWRRYKKAETASMRRTGETALIFEQEFPEDDETCFLTFGDSAYDSDIIAQKIRECFPAPIHKHMVNPTTGVSAPVDVWEDKKDNGKYLLSIDPGKGKTSESVAHIWTFQDGYNKKDGVYVPPEMKHLATLAGYYDEWEMAQYCKELGKYYNEAVIAPESNLDILGHLRDYPCIYYREDVRSGKLIKALGWETNTATKPYMITEVNRNMEYIECYDIRFWSQCKNIRRDPMRKSGISVTGADDHHDCGAIAIVCRSALPIERGFVGTAGWPDDWGK